MDGQIRIDIIFQGQIVGHGITDEERLRYINQLAENLGYENLESLSLYVSLEEMIQISNFLKSLSNTP